MTFLLLGTNLLHRVVFLFALTATPSDVPFYWLIPLLSLTFLSIYDTCYNQECCYYIVYLITV